MGLKNIVIIENNTFWIIMHNDYMEYIQNTHNVLVFKNLMMNFSIKVMKFVNLYIVNYQFNEILYKITEHNSQA